MSTWTRYPAFNKYIYVNMFPLLLLISSLVDDADSLKMSTEQPTVTAEDTSVIVTRRTCWFCSSLPHTEMCMHPRVKSLCPTPPPKPTPVPTPGGGGEGTVPPPISGPHLPTGTATVPPSISTPHLSTIEQCYEYIHNQGCPQSGEINCHSNQQTLNPQDPILGCRNKCANDCYLSKDFGPFGFFMYKPEYADPYGWDCACYLRTKNSDSSWQNCLVNKGGHGGGDIYEIIDGPEDSGCLPQRQR